MKSTIELYDPGNTRILDQEYYIDYIVQKKKIKGNTLFEVKWIGFDESQNTWEPKNHLPIHELELFKAKQTSKKINIEPKQSAEKSNSKQKVSKNQISSRADNKRYLIEKIIDSKKEAGGMFYLIKWQDYENDSNTWEPSKNIPDYIIQSYNEMQNKSKQIIPIKCDQIQNTIGKQKQPGNNDEQQSDLLKRKVIKILDFKRENSKLLLKVKWDDSSYPDSYVSNTWLHNNQPKLLCQYYEKFIEFTS